MSPEIRITVDGRPALTTALAALRHGKSLEAMRQIVLAYRVEPVHRLDKRTPLYDEEALGEVIAGMPGQGKGGGRKPSPVP